MREETVVGNATGGKSGSHGSKVILLRAWNHHHSLSLQTSSAAEQQRGVPLQATDALIYRIGPQPGGVGGEPSMCLTHEQQRRTPGKGGLLSA